MSVCATTLSRLVKHVLGGDGEDLDDLAVAEAGVADRLDVGLGDVSALVHDLGGEAATARVRLGVAGPALAVERDFLRADLRQVQAEIAVRREAVVATVDLRDGQRDPLARLHVECLSERATVGREALQARRGFGAIRRNMFGTTPSCLCTASRIGFEASGAASRAGIAIRDMMNSPSGRANRDRFCWRE